MQGNFSVSTLESYYFIPRQRMTTRTSFILHHRTVGKETAKTALSLISQHMTEPICFGHGIVGCSYLYTVATMKYRLYRRQLTVNTGINSMKSHLCMNFKSEIEHRGILWKHYASSFWRESDYVIIIERCRNTIHVIHFIGVESDVFKHLLEFLKPSLYVLFCTLGRTTKTVITYHTL